MSVSSKRTRDAVCCFLSDFTVVYANNTFRASFESSQQEIIGKSFLSVIPSACVSSFEENLKKISAANPSFSFIFESSEDGPTSNLTLQIEAVYAPEGKLSSYTAFVLPEKNSDFSDQGEEKYRLIFEIAANLITSVDKNGIIVECNHQIKKLLGYEKSEVVGKPISLIIHPESLSRAQESLKEILDKGYSYNKEYRMIAKDGHFVDVTINSSGINKMNGTYERTLCVISDISLQEKYEATVRESNVFQDSIAKMARLGEWQLDTSTLKIFWKKETFKIHEYSSDSVPTLDEAIAFFHPEDQGIIRNAVDKAISEGKEYDLVLRLITAKGNHKWIRTSCRAEARDGKVFRLLGIIQDITDYVNTDKELHIAQRFLRSAMDENPTPMMIFSGSELTLSFFNKAASEVFLRDKNVMNMNDVITKYGSAWQAFYPNGKPYEKSKLPFVRAVYSGEKVRNEVIMIELNGTRRWYSVNSSAVSDDKGASVAAISSLFDITDRKEKEQYLSSQVEATIKSNDILNTIINLLPVRVFWKGNDLRYLGCNKLFALDAGKNKPEEVIGKNDFDMSWKQQAQDYRDDDTKVIETGEGKFEYEEQQRTPKGNLIWLKTSKVPLIDAEGNIMGVLGTYEDTTKSKEKEMMRRKLLEDLKKFKSVTVDRELRMIELKKQVNHLSKRIRTRAAVQRIFIGKTPPL